MYKTMLKSLGYEINERTFRDIASMWKGVYAPFKPSVDESSIVYSGITHNPLYRQTKLPHITVLKNIEALDGKVIMGCTMGHHQLNERFPIMEIYEFLGYGAMVVDINNKESVEMYVAKPGSKVIIPSGCNMTLYNLSLEDLVTHDFANSYDGNNESTKDLQKESGPFMAVVYNEKNVEFRISPLWVNRQDEHGVKIGDYNSEALQVNIMVWEGEFEKTLTNTLTRDKKVREDFRKIGIQIVEASPSLILDGRDYGPEPLICWVLRGDKFLHKYFQIV